MSFYEAILALVSFLSFLLIVVLLVFFGWLLVWILFLSRFRFVRELIGGMTDSSSSIGSINESKRNAKTSKSKLIRKE